MKENTQNTIVADIYMLPTDKESLIVKHINNKLYPYRESKKHLYEKDCTYQYLYATTDEEIKEGFRGWVITGAGKLDQITRDDQISPIYGDKKIVATTNPELWNMMNTSYTTVEPHFAPAKIDTTFLQPYVDAYNSGKPIKQVKLEMEDVGGEEWMGDDYNGEPFWNKILQLKLKPNGSVVIHPIVERMYSREEVEEMMDILNNNIDSSYNIFKWFNETYPK